MIIKPSKIIGTKITEISNITITNIKTGEVLFTIDKGYFESDETYELTNFEDKLLFTIDKTKRVEF